MFFVFLFVYISILWLFFFFFSENIVCSRSFLLQRMRHIKSDHGAGGSFFVFVFIAYERLSLTGDFRRSWVRRLFFPADELGRFDKHASSSDSQAWSGRLSFKFS